MKLLLLTFVLLMAVTVVVGSLWTFQQAFDQFFGRLRV